MEILSYRSNNIMGNWDQADPNSLAPEQEQNSQHSMLGSDSDQQQTVLPDNPEQLRETAPELEQQQQQQQQPEQEQEQQNQAAPATPGWDDERNALMPVRVDDGNNDSGISPGHYTSGSNTPPSRQSPTMATNGEVLPADNVTPVPNADNSLPDSPQSITQPMEFQVALDYAQSYIPHECTEPTRAPATVGAMIAKEVLGLDMPEELEFSPSELCCAVCSYSTTRRISFIKHVRTHCDAGAAKCEPYEFTRSMFKQLLTTSNVNIGRIMPALDKISWTSSEHEFRVPRVNSHNSIKSYTCKQCPFIAMTKVDFWEHNREHIKAARILACPKCPFVTEYKHHLEYHLCNHLNSKPYKCEKCDYECVNKSMLNSHLKSHSNIYQFRCADCSYATKHCHSLKQHLRKYNHTPDVVLNTDGTPNPLLIIEPYSTRRGPKAKPKKDNQAPSTVTSASASTSATTSASTLANANANASTSANASVNVSTSIPMVIPMLQQLQQLHQLQQLQQLQRQHQQQQQQQQLQQLHRLQQQQQGLAMPQFQFNPINGFQGFNGQPMPPTPALNGFSYPILSSFPVGNPFNAGRAPPLTREQLQDATIKYLELTNNFLPPDSRPIPGDDFLNSQLVKDVAASYGFAHTDSVAIKQENLDTAESSTALDLSKPENSPEDLSINGAHASAAVPAQVSAAVAAAVASVAVPTKRRKGRASKVDRKLPANNDEEMPQDVQRSTPTESLVVRPPSTSALSSGDSKDTTTSSSSNEFTCHYCEINFGNEVMHSVHMGYHGFQNPFTCNMCGTQCDDKVSFFLHIARVQH